MKVTQLVGQGRIAQPETPVTLQFQGNKFTLSPSQLRQLTTGQPLQLQGTLGNVQPIFILSRSHITFISSHLWQLFLCVFSKSSLYGLTWLLYVYVSALGNILQIVSAPGQPLLRPQGLPMVMPTVPLAVPVQNSSGTPPPATSSPQQGKALLCPEVQSSTLWATHLHVRLKLHTGWLNDG